MDAHDISRISFGSEKQHYAGVRMQQGRVILDQDWNESEKIIHEESQQANIDIIGPFGSPDLGFRIENLQINGNLINFDIHNGTLYLGGLRLVMDPVAEEPTTTYESFRTQKDWLQQPLEWPVPQLENGEERYDLVYIESWQQAVSAVEDAELFEVALGGPDTTTRIRNMRRVKIASDIGHAECVPAWLAFQQSLQNDKLGMINEAHELIPDTRLFVDYLEIDDPDDLCAPDAVGGYLGAENQAIRVQLRDNAKLIWGFDNAAPLYRVEVSGYEVHFLTGPKDQHHWPLAGQIVEILPWSAVLANEEKVASLQGHLSRVKSAYNPDSEILELIDPLPPGFGEAWKNRPDSADLQNQDPPEYYYLRVWRGIPDDQPMLKDIVSGTSIALGNTGIQVTITGENLNPGDHWIIAARPETPNEVLPWSLEHAGGAPPHGIQRYFAPLAIIHWHVVNQAVEGAIIRDCRKTFRPLTDLETCCIFHVGDGINSHGDFNSIEEALQNLPDTGGHICVLPGEHIANVSIFERQNIRISGCGERSIVKPHADRLSEPIIHMAHSRNIAVDHLNFVHPTGTPIVLLDTDAELPPSSEIKIEHNHILGGEYGIFIEVDDTVRGKNHIYLGYNQVAIPDSEIGKRAIFCLADEVLIERNRLVVVPAPNPENPDDPREENDPPMGIFDPCADKDSIVQPNFVLATYLPKFYTYVALVDQAPQGIIFQSWGGIQIGGGSEAVRIEENTIIGGRSNGITLGSFPNLDRIAPNNEDVELASRWAKSKEHTATKAYHSKDESAAGVNELLVQNFRSFLYGIAINNNLIQDMGLSGIGALAFFDIKGQDDGLIVQVENLTIYRNIIRHCALQIPEELPEEIINKVGFGGIAISGCEIGRIEENRIEDNGISFIAPICGIYILNGEDVEISRNRILNNGPRTELTSENFGLSGQARVGNRAGIYIGMVFKRQFLEAFQEEVLSDGVPAAKIHDNIVVQPLGQALFIMAFGPISVIGNQFTSHEIDLNHTWSILAGTVLIFNLGVSKDLLRLLGEPKLKELASILLKEVTSTQSMVAHKIQLWFLQYLPSGSVLFANNQTTLDLRNLEIDMALSSQLILSFDDISYTGNQSECKGLSIDLPINDNGAPIDLDYVLVNTALFSFSIRTANNRFQEGFTSVFYSLLSLGFFNTTLGNQSSNCLLTYGSKEVFDNNIEEILPMGRCRERKEQIGKLSGMAPLQKTKEVKFVRRGQIQVG